MTTLAISANATKPVGVSRTRAGRVISAIPVAFLLFDSGIKFVGIQPVADSMTQLGYPLHLTLGIAVIELICLVAYLVPRTSVLGAVLLTGYLGGAIATHVRVESPLFSHVLFPVYVAALLWGGLYLRESRLSALLPLRK